MFDSLGKGINILIIMFIVSIPLSVWKLLEIIVWLLRNIKINIGG